MESCMKIDLKNHMGRRLVSAAAVLLGLGAVWAFGRGGVKPAFIERDSWRLIRAQVTEAGIEVETAGENLMLHRGVSVKADSQESKAFDVAYVKDGIVDEKELRWSSANDWENCDHWLEITFPEETRVGLLRLYWERDNALEYAVEYSEDGKNWISAAAFTASPEEECQIIYLDEAVLTRHLRLHVTDVRRQETDLSLYYQNISLLELEVYAGIEQEFLIETPKIGTESERVLPLPEVPEEFSLEFAGADYEMLIGADGKIEDTIDEVQAEVGFALEKDGVKKELPGMAVTIPANVELAADAGTQLPEDFAVMEWQGFGGTLDFAEASVEEMLMEPETVSGGAAGNGNNGAVEGGAAGSEGVAANCPVKPLGNEGYVMQIDAQEQKVLLFANTKQGLCWARADLERLAKLTGGQLPAGVIRDHPRYSVRGFGIDVGRRAISLELLYRIAEALAENKMNTLLVHLNDNQIISTSDYDGTLEGAYGLYAGFRLESDLKNENGEGVTSEDLFYTKEEFSQFVADAKAMGVNVIPEIDTPAHSLSITKRFPKLGLTGDPEGADQLDLSNPDAVRLGLDLWSEYLTLDGADAQVTAGAEAAGTGTAAAQNAVFAECQGVHIGMDEYFGDKAAYMSYLKKVIAHIQELAPEKDIYLWGSLSKMAEDLDGVSTDLRMHIWDVDWADPQDMYEEGFSIVNSLSSSLYIIPGGGYDRLDMEFLEERWQPNVFETAERTWVLPAWSERMLGACYMMWNDWSHLNGEDISEEDLFERFYEPLETIAEKLW